MMYAHQPATCKPVLLEIEKRPHTLSAAQSQKAVSAYFTSKQILPFSFAPHAVLADWSLKVVNLPPGDPTMNNKCFLVALFALWTSLLELHTHCKV